MTSIVWGGKPRTYTVRVVSLGRLIAEKKDLTYLEAIIQQRRWMNEYKHDRVELVYQGDPL